MRPILSKLEAFPLVGPHITTNQGFRHAHLRLHVIASSVTVSTHDEHYSGKPHLLVLPGIYQSSYFF